VVLTLAEILRTKQLWQADKLRAFAGGFADEIGGMVKILRGRWFAGHLN
jgi:hypothetical protein